MTRMTIGERGHPIPMIGTMHCRHFLDLMKRCCKYRHRNRHRYQKARRRIRAWLREPA